MGRSSSLVRTLALRAKGRRFKSGPAHSTSFSTAELKIFAELHVEKCVASCFKWFSNVLLRLRPRAFDFSTNSLSRYNTAFLLFDIAFEPARKRREDLFYKCGHFDAAKEEIIV